MNTIVAYKSVSVDGYATGPDEDLSQLHAWMDRPGAAEVTRGFFAAGAVVMGRRTMAAGEEPWGDDEVFGMPVFVLSHQRREPVRKGGTTFTFVGDLWEALDLARRVAGKRPVNLMGASVVQQALAAGLVDELRLHLVPVVLGGGTPLFAPGPNPVTLRTERVQEIDGVVHLTYRVDRSAPAWAGTVPATVDSAPSVGTKLSVGQPRVGSVTSEPPREEA
jgi:dihydrofolate reductase